MKRAKSKRDLKLTIDIELLEKVRPYINNLSAFVESCLRNYYKKNKALIDDADYKTSRLLLDQSMSIDESPNITYIMQHLPIQLALLPIVNDKVIGLEYKRVINVPSVDNPKFLSNNSLELKDKKYYFEIINNTNISFIKNQDNNNNIYHEADKLAKATWISKNDY